MRPLGGGRRIRDRIAKVTIARPVVLPGQDEPAAQRADVQTLDDLATAVNDLIDLVGDFDFGTLP